MRFRPIKLGIKTYWWPFIVAKRASTRKGRWGRSIPSATTALINLQHVGRDIHIPQQQTDRQTVNSQHGISSSKILHIVWPWDIGATRGALRKPDRAEKIWKTLKTETESWWEHLGHSLVRTGCDTNLNAQSSTLRSVGIEMYLYYQVICEPNKMIMKNNKKKNISYWNQNGQKHAAEQVNLNHIQFYSNSRPLNI